jgi:MFS superfamily sulfate permease-like transporter
LARRKKNEEAAVLTILVLMAALFVLVLPIWPYSRTWSVVPGSMVALVILTFLAFMLAGNIVA